MTTETDTALVEQARAIAVLAGRQAEKAEATRSPDPQVIEAIRVGGFARHFVPARYGGNEGSFAALKRAGVLVGSECPASAWCAVVAALMVRGAGCLPAEGRAQVWAGGPDTLIAGGIAPRGTAIPVDGGWSLSGTWPSVTAVEYSDWVLLAAQVPIDGDRHSRLFVVPRSAVTVAGTWDDIGMRATGSHTVVVDAVPVAATMSFPWSSFAEMDAPQAGPDGRAVPLAAVNTLIFCLPMLGAARGALREWQQLMRTKLTASDREPDFAYYAEPFARSASEIDAAEMLLDRVAQVADTAVTVDRDAVARNQRDCAFAAGLLIDAVDRLMRISGSAGHSAGGAFQRFWRDIHTAGGHAALQFGRAATPFARAQLTGAN
ncbi:acyl-CoA dehydrogenase family protein [Nocardia sp. NPDC056064]|uniref:acyl-CoA dehydrogenase family protein n=1 Tax=Nocardia sp. NPDC056064 TaxID=3345701 RepID=UPI0035DDB357